MEVYVYYKGEILSYDTVWDAISDLVDDEEIIDYYEGMGDYEYDYPYFGTVDLPSLMRLAKVADDGLWDDVRDRVYSDIVCWIEDEITDEDEVVEYFGLGFASNKEVLTKKYM